MRVAYCAHNQFLYAQLALKNMLSNKRMKDPWKPVAWDDEEKRAFEEGFAAHGKQFHLVSRRVCCAHWWGTEEEVSEGQC